MDKKEIIVKIEIRVRRQGCSFIDVRFIKNIINIVKSKLIGYSGIGIKTRRRNYLRDMLRRRYSIND